MAISEPKSAHLREVLLFAFNWKKSASEAHRMLEEVYSDHALSKSQCYRWFKKFQSGDFELDNEPHGKPPQKFEDTELQALLMRIVPKCRSNSQNSYRHENKSFLRRIVTSDEKWIQFSNPTRQKSWGLPGQFPKQTPRPNRFGKKAMLCIWWDQTGVVYFELLKPGKMVNTSRYEQQMQSLREALNEKRPEWREKHNNLILQHDNAPAHNATSREKFKEFKSKEKAKEDKAKRDKAEEDKAKEFKAIEEIETEFDKEYPSRDSILVVFKLLEINVGRLRSTNSQIEELMLDDENTTVQELEKEQDMVEQYERNFLLIEKKVAEYLDPKGNDQQGHGDVASIRSSPERSISCKLPKIALKVFDGTSLEWLGWWSQFEAIHENPSLSEVDKFHYLIQAMKVGTRAERLVKSYPLTEANYPKVIEALKDRFGDKVILTEVYVRQLLKLVINKVRKQNISLESLYDQVESHIRSLDSLGVDVRQNSSFLYPLVESSLPEELIRVWQRSDMAGYAKDEKELIPSVDQRLTSLLAFVRREVKGEQRIAYLKDRFGDSSRKRDTGHYVTGSHMAKIRENAVKRVPWCIVCQGNHWIQSCPRWRSMSVPARVEALRKAHACFKCLRVGHIGKTCRRAIRCAHCQGCHNGFLHRTNAMSQEDQDPNKLKMTGPKDPPASIDKQEVEFTGMHIRTAIPGALLATALIRIVVPHGNGGELVKELASFTLGSLTEPGWTLPMKALVVGRMTGLLPTKDLCLAIPSSWKVLPPVDPQFEKSAKVDVILGADVYGRLLLPDLKLCDRTHICAQNTKLGWVISGELPKKDQTSPHLVYSARVKCEDHHPDGLPQRFWEIKEIPSKPKKSEEDEFCGNLYKRRKNAPCRVAYGQSGGDTSWEGRPGAGCFGADISWSAPKTLGEAGAASGGPSEA
ncbi:hypothetical protein LAZ67_3005410 [Cordylochernes scorpioides]|uniref:CCHC-type domain-containing protein n=1 Tax=Cordylochernes scorpioides TaxID=51811 RepID=A0ABY6KAC2_9ARAC|nr:hypothetical protein LAZ67_3005410 [Cordylochernes scorpioides]